MLTRNGNFLLSRTKQIFFVKYKGKGPDLKGTKTEFVICDTKNKTIPNTCIIFHSRNTGYKL